MRKELLRLSRVSKRHNEDFSLRNVTLSIYEGETVKIVSDDALSQVVLARLLGGLEVPDSGEILLDGSKVVIDSPFQGRKLGIHVVYKRSDFIPNLSVNDNLYLDHTGPEWRLPKKQREQAEKTGRLLQELGIDISPSMPSSELSTEQLQLLRLGKALLEEPRLVVIDYAYILMPYPQIRRFLSIIRMLKERNVTVIILSQNPKAFYTCADRVFFLQGGTITADIDPGETDPERWESMAEIFFQPYRKIRRRNVPGDEVLRVSHFSDAEGGLKDVSFTLREGEILGLVFQSSSEPRQLAHSLFGLEKTGGGSVYVNGSQAWIRSTADAMRMKIGLFSCEDRENGLFRNLDIRQNVMMSAMGSPSGISQSFEKSRRLMEGIGEKYRLGMDDSDAAVTELSLAEQRRINLARVLLTEPHVLMVIEPTVYLDESSKREIMDLLTQYADEGGAVLLLSAGYQELLRMSDRILVMRDPDIPETEETLEFEENEQLYMFHNIEAQDAQDIGT